MTMRRRKRRIRQRSNGKPHQLPPLAAFLVNGQLQREDVIGRNEWCSQGSGVEVLDFTCTITSSRGMLSAADYHEFGNMLAAGQ